MNKQIVEAAKRALTANGFEKRPHYCQRWVRQLLESEYGMMYAPLCLENAVLSGKAFLRGGYGIPLKNGSVPGDLLYKLTGSGGDGHVGVRIPGNLVAENASLHWDGKDARGTRTLKEFGHFDLIIRLPER